VFGPHPGSAVDVFAQDVGVPGMPVGLAEDVDQDGEQVRVSEARDRLEAALRLATGGRIRPVA
jgi:hypothetical protein